MRIVLVVVGVVVAAAGIVWTLQGVGDIGGSSMSGNSTWAVIGPVTAVAGLAIAAVAGAGLFRKRGGRARS